MCLIEEYINSSDKVCGVVQTKINKISIWTGNAKRKDVMHASYRVCVCVHTVRSAFSGISILHKLAVHNLGLL